MRMVMTTIERSYPCVRALKSCPIRGRLPNPLLPPSSSPLAMQNQAEDKPKDLRWTNHNIAVMLASRIDQGGRCARFASSSLTRTQHNQPGCQAELVHCRANG